MRYFMRHHLLPIIDNEIYNIKPLNVWVGGRRFRNPIGVAAGFDVAGDAFPATFDFGYGFCELGPSIHEYQIESTRANFNYLRYRPDVSALLRMGIR